MASFVSVKFADGSDGWMNLDAVTTIRPGKDGQGEFITLYFIGGETAVTRDTAAELFSRPTKRD